MASSSLVDRWRSCGAAGLPRKIRSKPVTPSQARAYMGKAEEYLDAAVDSLQAGRVIAATSLAIHAGINAADVVTGIRLGTRAAGDDHEQALTLLRQAGRDGTAVAKELARLLPMKTRAEYEPDEIPQSAANKAVERARRCVVVARNVLSSRAP